MPVTLTDDPSTFPDIQAPTSSDGRDAVSMVVPLQRLANRTRQTKNRIDAIAPSTDGVRVLRTVASIAALQAIGAVDHTDNSYAYVEDYGLYRYDINSLATASSPFVVQPTDVVGGGTPGRWILGPFSALNAANGIPQCDSAGRVPAATVRNGIFAYGHVELGIFSTNSLTFVDVPGSAISIPSLAIGDIVMWDYSAAVLLQATSTLDTQGIVIRPDTTTVVPTNMETSAANVTASISSGAALGALVGTYICTQAGTHVFKVQAKTDGHTQSLLNLNARVMVLRP